MKIHPVKDLYEIEIANIKKRNLNQGIGLKSDYPEMDTIMGGIGFEPGFIYTIASRPGMGKTALMLNLVFNQLSNLSPQDCIVYVSTKDSSTVLMQKILAIASGIDLKKIQLGQLSDQELSVLQSSDILGMVSNDKLVFVEAINPTFDALKEVVSEQEKNGKQVKMLAIDVIQSAAIETAEGKEEGFKNLMNELKVLAIAKQIPMLLASDVNRRVEYRNGPKIPQLTDLLYSGHIGYLSDFCFMLVRPNYYEVPGEYVNLTPEEAHLIVKKNVYGPLDTIVLHVQIAKQLFIAAPKWL
jgi:replicative DNA helicase